MRWKMEINPKVEGKQAVKCEEEFNLSVVESTDYMSFYWKVSDKGNAEADEYRKRKKLYSLIYGEYRQK